MKNIAYGSHERHVLDVYAPAGAGSFPVVLFIHGGGWREGSKDLYPHLGEWLARHNLVGVLMNYRLTPEVIHPDHTRDCALALAWVHAHIGEYGGDSERLYLTGFSAGGHMAALLATNGDYLAEQGLSPGVLKGVVTMSGVYQINYLLDLTGYGGAFPWGCRREASPLNHVRPGLPPWVVVYANNDYATLDWQAQKLYAALKGAGGEAWLRVIESDHPLLTENLVNDRQAAALVSFFRGLKKDVA